MWLRDLKRILLNLNSSPIPSWKLMITPFEIMFHKTSHILARPSMPDYKGMTEQLQEMARGQARAQDVCRELCECMPHSVIPGAGMKIP
jgi:hypothetical protein